MVLLGYLRQSSTFCSDDCKSFHNNRAYSDCNGILGRQSSISRARWGLLGPAVRVIKGGAKRVNSTVLQLRDGITEEQRTLRLRKEERRQILRVRMENAETREQWRAAATDLDVLEDNEAWKYDTQSDDFDAPLIEARLKQLDDARTNCDIKTMLYLVRTALSRDVGGVGNIRLYKHSHVGTKDLIERYIDSTLATIKALLETSKYSLPEGLETKDILEQVVHARQAFGRSALLLSGGATFGMNHVGVLKALFEARLLPRIISGASAGSIVCAVLCTRTDEEIPDLMRTFPFGDLAVFEENGNEESVLERVRRLLTKGAWIDIKHLTRVMQELLGDMTFQEAYNRTRRILNICVSSASVYELPRLLNYVTAPNVMIWSAVAASCSVPFLFSAAQLLVKSPITGENKPWNPTPQRWIDGSVDNDLPMTRLAEMFNVNHFIVSQVNPHVVPFLAKDDEYVTRDAQKEGETGPGWVYTLTNLAKDEALHRMQVLAELGVFPNLVSKCRSVLSQKYSGDITILPAIAYKDFPRILKNPTAEFMVQTCLSGERATWPKLSRVKNHCAVELELDAAVQTLRARVVFSPSQVDLRRMRAGTLTSSTRRAGRNRRESGSNVQALHSASNGAEDEENAHDSRKSLNRLTIKPAGSRWTVPKRSLLPLASSPHFSLPTPRPGDTPSQPLDLQLHHQAPYLNLQVPETSSACETSFSSPSSDADVDSHTDESSLEPDANDDLIPGSRLFHSNSGQDSSQKEQEIDFFSASQPITPSTDHVLATTPSSSRLNVGLRLSVPNQAPKTGLKVSGPKSFMTPSSPEKRYKRLFHGPVIDQPHVSRK